MHGRLWSRLKQRKLVQWGLGYLAGAILVLEVGDILTDAFGWPSTLLRVLTVVLAFAFLAVLVVAWFHGEQGHQRVTKTEAFLLSGLCLATIVVSSQVAVRVPAAAAGSNDSGDPAAATRAAPIADIALAGPSLAVLPFVNIGGDEQDEYFSDGVTEDIIAQLSRLDGVRVISRTTVMQYKATQKTVRQIGEELGVHAVLEGSVRRSGDQVRIVAQLIDARTDEHLWTETYDRGIEDILKIQGDVAQQIASALEAQLSPAQVAELGAEGEVDPEAYTTYLQGRQLAKSDAPEDRRRAAELYTMALSMDSGLVQAYSALAEAMLPEGLGDVADVGSDVAMVGGEVPMVGGELPQVDIIVERAMAMVPKAPEIQTLMVRKALERWDLGAADSAARKAVAEHPNYAAAHHWYGVVLGRQGRFSDALRELEAARSLDPLSRSINTDLGELYYASGRFDDAIQQLRRTIERHPRHVEARVNLALALAASGEGDAAIAELRKAVELAPGNPVVLGHIGQVLADAGRREEAEIILQDLLHRAERQSIPPSAVAQIYAGLGDREAAVRWLERAADERSSALVSPRVGRLFGDLRQDPRLARVFDLVPRGPQPPHVPQPPTADSSRVRRPPPR